MAEKGLREDGYPMGPIFPEEGSSIAEQFPKALAYADTDSSRWFVSDIKVGSTADIRIGKPRSIS